MSKELLLAITAILLLMAACSSSEPTPNPTQSVPSPVRAEILGLRPPNANVLASILWLGCKDEGSISPSGSGVLVNFDGQEYLVTALHVLENCPESGLVRMNSMWNQINWESVIVDEDADIAVLKTETSFDIARLPVQLGKQHGMVYGQIGYALGYPSVLGHDGTQVNHIAEVNGRPIPAVALAVWNFQQGPERAFATSYVSPGYSGGTIVFPIGNGEWTVAGIINTIQISGIRMKAKLDGEEKEHLVGLSTGIVAYTPMEKVEALIRAATK